MIKIFNIIIYLLLLIGVFASTNLAINEFNHANTCPKLGFLPACYLVFVCFLIPLIVHHLKKYTTLFFIFTGLAFGLAIFASIGQILGKISCPLTNFGLPKCYLSFGLLLITIWLKLFLITKTNTVKT